MGFRPSVADKALVACGRHCCICHKFSSFKIELHHIVQKADSGEDSFENCIPLCFDCHADVKAYDPKHPKGRKYTESELKAHRDEWYQKVKQSTNISIAETTKTAVASVGREGGTQALTNIPESNRMIDQNARMFPVSDSKNEHDSEQETSESIDYIFSAPEEFKEELSLLNAKVANLRHEKVTAEDLGLKGPSKATKKELEQADTNIKILQQRIAAIEQGYAFWDKVGFIMALEACALFDSWHCLGVIEQATLKANEDFDMRIPEVALEDLGKAIDSKLFSSFIICVAVEPSCDTLVPYPEWVGYYLFGSPSNVNSSDNSELFEVSFWGGRQ